MNLSNISFAVIFPTEGAIDREGGIVSEEFRGIAEQVIVFILLCPVFTGFVTNTINIRVFVEQGVKNDNTNIGLLSLSVFDLMTCLFLTPFCLCYLLRYIEDLPTSLSCISYSNVIGYPVFALFNCSTWSTVYLSLERSLCVVIPLKVKLYLKPKVTLVVIVAVLVTFMSLQMTYASHTTIVWIFHPLFNESIAFVADSPFARRYLNYYSMTSNTILASVAIFIVTITTSIMVRKLIECRKWRRSNMNSSSKDTSGKKPLASKDVELIKSVTTVTCIFLVCLSISHIPTTLLLSLPGMSFAGINRNLFSLIYLLRILFGSINASINFFFYIRISSRYKAAFATVFAGRSSVNEKIKH